MDSAKRILPVESDVHITELPRMHLRDEGYAAVHAAGGHTSQREMERGNWDALILNLTLPGIDDLEICRRARVQARYTPIIIISARSIETYRILGLELGIDDYLVRSPSVLGLMVRAEALIRRTGALARNAYMGSDSLTLGNLEIEPPTREACVDGKPVELMPCEPDLLHFLARYPGKMFSRLNLLNQVWSYQCDSYEYTANTHIDRLRTKVEVDSAQPRHIPTAWGRGYKLSIEVDGKEDAI